MTNSFRKMSNDGVIKRRDGEQIRYADIHIEPGYNAPGRTEEDDEDDERLYQHIIAGGYYPELEVRPRDDGGVWLVDGHRRHKQFGRGMREGKIPANPKDGQFWMKIKQFEGSDIDRVVRIATSNEGKKLTPFQRADVYKRLAAFGLNASQIAEKVHHSRKHVEDMLALANSNHDVQNAVKAGEIASTTAIGVIKEHGEKAGAVIADEVKKAKAQGLKRATPGTMKPWTPPKRYATPMITAAERLVDAINLADRMRLENGCTDDTTMISVPAIALAALLKPHEDIAKARQEAAQRIRDRTLETSQGDMVKEAA